MRRVLFLATIAVATWCPPVHAQFHHREHEFHPGPRFAPFERHSLPPREGQAESIAPHHPGEPGKTAHKSDSQLCDSPDADPDAAIEACGRIIARGQVRGGYSLPVAYVHRGQAYDDKGDFDHAVADFSEAIRLKPAMAGYFVLRGDASEKSGNTDAARDDYRRAANLDPKNQEALKSLKRIETRSSVNVAGAPAAAPAPVASATQVTNVAPTTQVTNATPPAAAAAIPPTAAVVATAAAASQAPDKAALSRTSVAEASPIGPAGAVKPSAVAAAQSGPADGTRVALVIGNGAYVNANRLPNPPNDAHAIAEVLRQIGFDVKEGENLDHAAMETLLHEFLHKAQNASVVLLFYAGHGMQVDGKNYLVPVDAKLAEASDLPFETIEIDKLLDSLGDPGHTNIILLDACRDNPLARSFASHLPATRSAAVATGLAAYSAVGTGTLIAYATAPGQTALDGQGKDSPFTTSLLHFLPTPGLEIRQVLTRVRAEVASETGNRQIPWDNSSLMGDVVLVNQPAEVAKTAEH